MIDKLACVLAVVSVCVSAQPYSGTIFDFPDSFKDTDSTALIGVEYGGRLQKSVYDRRVGNTTINAYAFTARFGDGSPAWTIMVNPEFSQSEAKALAEKYARNIGQMPICIRSGITGAVIHDGVNPWGGGNPLTIHHGQGLSYERSGIVTETMVHEATHAAFDRIYYDAEWKDAAKADGQFISTYARDNPGSEDHSETFLCWLAVRYKKDRISPADYAKITAAVPNRLKWYDEMDFKLSPMVHGVTAANEDRPVPSPSFALLAGRYDPVRSSVAISYEVPKSAGILLQVLDLKGGLIRTLAQEQARPGRYRKYWDIHDDAGRRVPGGAYAFRLIAGDFQAARSMAIHR